MRQTQGIAWSGARPCDRVDSIRLAGSSTTAEMGIKVKTLK
jgi:hypothetical protein